MGILSNITAKDIFILIMGGTVGYFINLIVAAQTAKKKKLSVELISRETKLDEEVDYPYTMADNNTGEILENCYCICIMIWNKGNLEIKHSDIDPKNPLIIYLDSTARVIGNPRSSFKNEYIDFTIVEIESNHYRIDFNCLNPKEGIELEFYITGNPYASVNVQGHIYGGESQFIKATDDDILNIHERLRALLLVLIYISIPVSLLIGLIGWFVFDYSFTKLIEEPKIISEGSNMFLLVGILSIILILLNFTFTSVKRKHVPKHYPIQEDYIPGFVDCIKIYWFAAITGKRSMVKKIISKG